MYVMQRLNAVRIAEDDKTRQKLLAEGYTEITPKKKVSKNGENKT